MTPAFALDLNHDSIRLLRRGVDGWDDLGGVALDDPDFAANLSALRDTAKSGSSEAFETLLIIPESQILYTTVILPGSLPRIRDADVASALEGVTPLAVDELAFDWRQTDGGIRVAVLEINTLDEAESFAAQYGFNPVGFTADSTPEQFPGAPDFGPLRADRDAAAGKDAIEDTAIEADTNEDLPPRDSESGDDASRDAGFGDSATFASVRASDMDVVKTASPAVAMSAEASLQERENEPAGGSQDPAPAAAAQGNQPGVFGNRAMPFEAAEGFRGPGLVILVVLVVAAALIWLALYLVRPDERATEIGAVMLPATGPGVETAPEPAPAESAAPLGQASQDQAQAEPASAPEAPLQPAADTPAAAAAPQEAQSDRAGAVSRRGTPPETQLPVTGLPAPDTSLLRAAMRARGRAAGFAPEADAFAPLAELTALPRPAALAPLVRQAAPAALAEFAPPAAPALQTDLAAALPAPVFVVIPAPPDAPAESELDTLYVASIDPVVFSGDAIALPLTEDAPPRLAAPGDPPPAGTVFAVGPDGLVTATPEGALTPQGIIVTAGPPPVRSPARPSTGAFAPAPQTNVALRAPPIRPRPRPGRLLESNERATLGGRLRSELAQVRPRPRPPSAQSEAMAAAVQSAVTDALEAPQGQPTEIAASRNAIAISLAPRHRPANFASRVETARAANQRNEAASVSAAVAAPQGQRSSTVASVARQATTQGAIDLRRLNLIGVYGSASDRRALIRLPSGRYVKVQVGDSLDGGEVSSISEGALRYIKRGKAVVLAMPSG